MQPLSRKALSKIIIGIVIALVIVVIYGSIFLTRLKISPSNSSSQTTTSVGSVAYEYKISLVHNGAPLDFQSLAASANYPKKVFFGIDLYNRSTFCPIVFSTNGTSSTTYSFSDSSLVPTKALADYRNGGYVFDLYSVGFKVTASIASKDTYDATMNFNELPSLANNYSITFDVPLFNLSATASIISGNSTTFHAQLADSWNGNKNFVCRFSRDYAQSDSNISDCDSRVSFLWSSNTLCARRQLSQCGMTNSVMYVTNASVSGSNVDCVIPNSVIAGSTNYTMRLISFAQIGQNLYSSLAFHLN